MTSHTSPTYHTPPLRKLCFVTVGATAPFPALLHAVLHPTFLRALVAHQYTDLLLQYGRGGEIILQNTYPATPDGRRRPLGLHLAGFDFRDDGLAEEYRATKGMVRGYQTEGLVVSHAGTLWNV